MLEEGKDYVYAPKTTYVGGLGVGEGCLLGTRRSLLMVPTKIDSVVWNRSITTTRFQLGNEPIAEGIRKLLVDPELDAATLEAMIGEIAAKVDGAAHHDLTQMKRLRVRAGWFSRGIYVNAKEGGVGGWAGYPLKGKGRAQHWMMFYRDMPIFTK